MPHARKHGHHASFVAVVDNLTPRGHLSIAPTFRTRGSYARHRRGSHLPLCAPRDAQRQAGWSALLCSAMLHVVALCTLGLWPFSTTGGTAATPRVHVKKHKHSCATTRRLVYVDLGVNWANTLRLYKDLGPGLCSNATHWEIYGFEAVPLIQPYANHFVEFLNGQVPRPPWNLPLSGSSEELYRFAKRFGCTKHAPLHPDFKNCMWKQLGDSLMALRPNERLQDPKLVADRLRTAASSNVGSSFPRYVFVPAAAGDESKLVNLTYTRIGILHGGGSVGYETSDDKDPAWQLILSQVPQVDIPTWLTTYFRDDDLLVVKMDIEGAEHPLLKKLLAIMGSRCMVDVLAWQCHDYIGEAKRCDHMRTLLRSKCPNMRIIEEAGNVATDYEGIDSTTKKEIRKLMGAT